MANKEKIEKKGRREKVLAVMSRIPKGKVCFYGDIANASGIKGGKAVAPIISTMYQENPNLQGFHWHRVVKKNGKLSEFDAREKQKELLMQEGVQIEENYYINLQGGTYWKP